jgi:hypothetical protein
MGFSPSVLGWSVMELDKERGVFKNHGVKIRQGMSGGI